jgi:hypothetical protein
MRSPANEYLAPHEAVTFLSSIVTDICHHSLNKIVVQTPANAYSFRGQSQALRAAWSNVGLVVGKYRQWLIKLHSYTTEEFDELCFEFGKILIYFQSYWFLI